MSVQETAEWMLEQLAPTRHYTDADTRRRARILSIVALLVAIVGGVRGTLLFLFGIQAAGVGLQACFENRETVSAVPLAGSFSRSTRELCKGAPSPATRWL